MNLRGRRILNTRPLDQGLALSQAIHDAGGLSIDLPALVIEPTSREWLNDLPDLARVHHAIFISSNAVNYFFATLNAEQLVWPATIQTTAMGKATALALEKRKIRVDNIPSIADSDHLLQLNTLQQVQNQTILLVKGVGGRTEITNTLLTRDARLTSLEVYHRALPNKMPQHIYSLWQDNLVDIILFTSEQAIHNIFTLFGEEARGWLCKIPCVVISERLAIAASLLGMQTITVSRYDTILSALAQCPHQRPQ